MTNPLIDKFYELNPEQKEKPKPPKNYIQAENSSVSFKSYDYHNGEKYYLEVAELVKQKKARVNLVSMDMGTTLGVYDGLKQITFKVDLFEL